MNPIVLLHGALGSGKQLEPIREALAKQTDRTIHFYNFPGHGGEDVPTDGFRMDKLAKDFGAWLSLNNIMGADIFGYSMGGYVALLTVRKNPERIRHILTLGTKFDWSVEGAKRETKHLNAKVISEKVPKYAQHLENLHGGHWVDVLSATAQLMTHLGAKPLLNEYTLQMIQHPVVITRGSEDKMVSAEESEQVAIDLPDARYEEVVGWPHPLEKLDPTKLTAHILKHLN